MSIFSKLFTLHRLNDFFISYSRQDGIEYGLKLANKLQSEGYRCFIDQYETEPGEAIPKVVMDYLQRSSHLIVIGTEGACASEAVRHELTQFQNKKSITVVDVDHAVSGAVWGDLVAGLPLHNCTKEEFAALETDKLATLATESFNYTKTSKRLRRITAITVAFILALVISGISISVFYSSKALDAAAELNETRTELQTADAAIKSKEDSLGILGAQQEEAQNQINEYQNSVKALEEEQNVLQKQNALANSRLRASAKSLQYTVLLEQASQYFDSHPESSLDLLGQAISAIPSNLQALSHLRNFSKDILYPLVRLKTGARIVHIELNHDSTKLVALNKDGVISIVDLQTWKSHTISTSTKLYNQEKFVFVDDNTIVLEKPFMTVDVNTRKVEHIVPPDSIRGFDLFSANNNAGVFLLSRGFDRDELYFMDLQTKKSTRINDLVNLGESIDQVVVAPSGSKLLISHESYFGNRNDNNSTSFHGSGLVLLDKDLDPLIELPYKPDHDNFLYTFSDDESIVTATKGQSFSHFFVTDSLHIVRSARNPRSSYSSHSSIGSVKLEYRGEMYEYRIFPHENELTAIVYGKPRYRTTFENRKFSVSKSSGLSTYEISYPTLRSTDYQMIRLYDKQMIIVGTGKGELAVLKMVPGYAQKLLPDSEFQYNVKYKESQDTVYSRDKKVSVEYASISTFVGRVIKIEGYDITLKSGGKTMFQEKSRKESSLCYLAFDRENTLVYGTYEGSTTTFYEVGSKTGFKKRRYQFPFNTNSRHIKLHYCETNFLSSDGLGEALLVELFSLVKQVLAVKTDALMFENLNSGQIHFSNPERSTFRTLPRSKLKGIQFFQYSEKSNHAIIADSLSNIYIYNVVANRLTELKINFTKTNSTFEDIVLSKDGEKFVIFDQSENILLCDIEGNLLGTFTGESALISNDSKYLRIKKYTDNFEDIALDPATHHRQIQEYIESFY